MSRFDGMTPEQRTSEWRGSTVLNALSGAFGIGGVFLGAAMFYTTANMTFEDYKKDLGPAAVSYEIHRLMGDRIDAMRDQFLEKANGEGAVSLNTGGENLSVDREAMNQRLKSSYENLTASREVGGGLLAVLGTAATILSVGLIRRDSREMQAAAAKDASSPAPQ